MTAPVTIAIQAGGKSTRMGRDKAFVPLHGRPLIDIVRDRVAGLGEELIIITNAPAAYAHLGVPLFSDIVPDCGPLGGILTAVTHARFPHTLVVACDMPWLNPNLLRYLIGLRETADVVVPRWGDYPEPLHALYGKACLPAIRARLQASERKATSFFADVAVRTVARAELARFDPQGRSFTNVNTPAELEAAAAA